MSSWLNISVVPDVISMQEAGESFAAPTQDTEEGPPRTEGVVPLPQSERGGRREATQGVNHLNSG